MSTGKSVDSSAPARKKRADAERNTSALVESAQLVFATSGIDAPAKEIADAAGLGVGTLYRHFPRRTDLVMAVLTHEIDACAREVAELRARATPFEALREWVSHYVELVGTKRGLAGALHSEDAAFEGLHAVVAARLEPAVIRLIQDCRDEGTIRSDVTAREFLYAIALLCQAVPSAGFDLDFNQRMIAIFVEGLRSTAAGAPSTSPQRI